MAAKSKRSSVSLRRSISENVLPKKNSTPSRDYRGSVNEGEFSYNFRKFCIECNTTVIPNVKVVFPEDLRDNLTGSCSNVSKTSETSSAAKQQAEQKEMDEALASIPEILAVQDETTTAICEVIFRQFKVNRDMLVALTKTLKSGTFLRSVKLEFCYLKSKEITALHLILRMVDTITEVSVDGNPNDYQNFYVLLKDTKLLSLSLRFCGIDKIGARKIADRINSFSPQTLMRLNLSSNALGDEGLAYIMNALRVNRSLLFLNVADNQITDSGCEVIAEVLQKFPLNESEVRLRRKRIFAYLRRKSEMMDMYSCKSKTTVSTNTTSKRSSHSAKKLEAKKEKGTLKGCGSVTSSQKTSSGRSKSMRSEFERIEVGGEFILAPDQHPLVKFTQVENRELYCSGNNKLLSLNLAYNKITQVGLRMLTQMLSYQLGNFFAPDVGILRLTLEGNSAPNCCSEVNEILDFIAQKNESLQSSVSLSRSNRSDSRSVTSPA